jgi:hypothetical protein
MTGCSTVKCEKRSEERRSVSMWKRKEIEDE